MRQVYQVIITSVPLLSNPIIHPDPDTNTNLTPYDMIHTLYIKVDLILP